MTLHIPTWPAGAPSPPPRSRRWVVWLLLVLMTASVTTAVWWWRSSHARGATGAPPATARLDTAAFAPAGTRIVVRVVNISGTRGLARRATLWLRDLGYDVVDFDSAPQSARAETVIEVHTGHTEWAERVRHAFGTGRVVIRPDSLRYVDLTVFVGGDWQPPAEPLRP